MRSNTDINVMYKSLAWNLLDFMHEICWILHEICQISWSTTECCIFFIHEIQYRYKWKSLAWNLVNSGFFFRTNTDTQYYMLNRQEISWSTTEYCIFHQNQSPWHEICQISPWNPPDFMKSTRFHEIHWFHEICQISPWNPLDFTMKSAEFHE